MMLTSGDRLLYSGAGLTFLFFSFCDHDGNQQFVLEGGSMKRVWGFVCAVFILLLASQNAWAQAGATAQISGTVKDSSGGVLPGVDVTATQTDTGLKRNTATDADGSYSIP